MTMLGINFAARFASLFAGKLVAVTLTHKTPGAYNSADPTAGTNPTSVTYTCQAAVSAWKETMVPGNGTRNVKFELIVLLATMSTAGIRPQPGDTVAFTPPGMSAAITAAIAEGGVAVDEDAASATCSCSTN